MVPLDPPILERNILDDENLLNAFLFLICSFSESSRSHYQLAAISQFKMFAEKIRINAETQEFHSGIPTELEDMIKFSPSSDFAAGVLFERYAPIAYDEHEALKSFLDERDTLVAKKIYPSSRAVEINLFQCGGIGSSESNR